MIIQELILSGNRPIIDNERFDYLYGLNYTYESDYHIHILRINAVIRNNVGVNLEVDFYNWLANHKKYLLSSLKKKSELEELLKL